MRVYTYFRVNVFSEEKDDYNRFLSMVGCKIPESRMILEEVKEDVSLKYRNKFLDLINHSIENGDYLFISGLDSLGSNFNEINSSLKLIFKKKVRLICFEFSGNEISGDIKKLFIHFFKMASDFEERVHESRKIVTNKNLKRAGRPEILNNKQKDEVMALFKKGQSVYSIAKQFSVTRTVILRLISKKSIDINSEGN